MGQQPADHITPTLHLKQCVGSRIAAPAIDQLPCVDIGIEEGIRDLTSIGVHPAGDARWCWVALVWKNSVMRTIQVKQLGRELTPTADLALVGNFLKTLAPASAAVDAALPVRTSVATSDIVRSSLDSAGVHTPKWFEPDTRELATR